MRIYSKFTVTNKGVLAALTGMALLIGCGGSTPTGSLVVIVTSDPSITPSVTVSGPSGFSQAINATQTLTNLAPGAYTVAVATVKRSNAIVDDLFNGAVAGGGSVTVSSSNPAVVAVTYTRRSASGSLWVADYPDTANKALRISNADLTSSAALNISSSISLPDAGRVYSTTFDALGNVWITNNTNKIYRYTGAQLAAGGALTPDKTITVGSGLIGAAFDAAGNLWIAAANNNAVLQLTPVQLATGGMQTPMVTISANDGSLNYPVFPTFDSVGNLWVSSNVGKTLVKFTPAQYATSGSPVPSVTISGSGISGPLQIAFDKTGNLWVANSGNNSVVKYNISDLSVTGSPTPAVQLTGANISGSLGLAFDNTDNLWVSALIAQKIVRFTPAQLSTSGSPVPNVILTTTESPAGLTFYPTPSGYPIK